MVRHPVAVREDAGFAEVPGDAGERLQDQPRKLDEARLAALGGMTEERPLAGPVGLDSGVNVGGAPPKMETDGKGASRHSAHLVLEKGVRVEGTQE